MIIFLLFINNIIILINICIIIIIIILLLSISINLDVFEKYTTFKAIKNTIIKYILLTKLSFIFTPSSHNYTIVTFYFNLLCINIYKELSCTPFGVQLLCSYGSAAARIKNIIAAPYIFSYIFSVYMVLCSRLFS